MAPPAPKRRRAERDPADQQRAQQSGQPAEQADEHRLGDREACEARDGCPPRAQERLLAAAIVGSGARHDDRQEGGQHCAGETEEEKRDARVETVAARGVQGRREVVGDDSGPRQARLEILGEALRCCERARGVAWEHGVPEFGLHLVAHEPGPYAREAVEQPVPASRGENDHVVGRWKWSSRACRPHRPEKLLWRREVDHAVDPESHGPQRSALDADRVADGHTEVGGSLLGEQDALASPDELPELVGVGAPVVRRNAEHEAGAGSPVDTMRPGGEPADARVVDEQCRAHAREMRDRAPDMGRARARLRLDLPIQRHARQRPLRHGRGRSREERSDCRDQRNRDGDARGRRENARPPVQDQAGEPARNHQAALRSLRRRPSEMLQHCSSRAAISASCVATTSAAPVASAASRSTSTTCAAVAVSS